MEMGECGDEGVEIGEWRWVSGDGGVEIGEWRWGSGDR